MVDCMQAGAACRNKHHSPEDFRWRRFHSCLGLMRSWLSLLSGMSSSASPLLPLPRDLARGVPSTTINSVNSSTISTNTRHQHTPTPQELHHFIVGGSVSNDSTVRPDLVIINGLISCFYLLYNLLFLVYVYVYIFIFLYNYMFVSDSWRREHAR